MSVGLRTNWPECPRSPSDSKLFFQKKKKSVRLERKQNVLFPGFFLTTDNPEEKEGMSVKRSVKDKFFDEKPAHAFSQRGQSQRHAWSHWEVSPEEGVIRKCREPCWEAPGAEPSYASEATITKFRRSSELPRVPSLFLHGSFETMHVFCCRDLRAQSFSQFALEQTMTRSVYPLSASEGGVQSFFIFGPLLSRDSTGSLSEQQ